MRMAATTSPHHGSVQDGFLVAPQTWDLLHAAEIVTVVTNSRSVPGDHFHTIPRHEHEAFVVFNRHRFAIDDRLARRTVWVHRIDETNGRYFGGPEDAGGSPLRFHHLRVAGHEPQPATLPADESYLSYRAALPHLAGYPVGRRLLVPQHGIRRIASPSTGFAIFALLAELQRRGAGFEVRAVGVGREYDGWPGHDWMHERRCLGRGEIDFRRPDGRVDRWKSLLDTVPYELVRLAGKLTNHRHR